ncbi:hypothetical protein Tco_0618121 [Tanacetum coccineum]
MVMFKNNICVESLVGALFCGWWISWCSSYMKWFGMSCDLDPSHIKEAFEIASLHTHTLKLDVIQCLEKKLGYEFKVKGLLAGVDGWLPEIVEHPLKNMVDRGIFDSGCSGHMTGNKDQLEDFEEFNGGSVTFGGSKGYISGKGKIRVGNLDFDSVSFVKELGHFM